MSSLKREITAIRTRTHSATTAVTSKNQTPLSSVVLQPLTAQNRYKPKCMIITGSNGATSSTPTTLTSGRPKSSSVSRRRSASSSRRESIQVMGNRIESSLTMDQGAYSESSSNALLSGSNRKTATDRILKTDMDHPLVKLARDKENDNGRFPAVLREINSTKPPTAGTKTQRRRELTSSFSEYVENHLNDSVVDKRIFDAFSSFSLSHSRIKKNITTTNETATLPSRHSNSSSSRSLASKGLKTRTSISVTRRSTPSTHRDLLSGGGSMDDVGDQGKDGAVGVGRSDSIHEVSVQNELDTNYAAGFGGKYGTVGDREESDEEDDGDTAASDESVDKLKPWLFPGYRENEDFSTENQSGVVKLVSRTFDLGVERDPYDSNVMEESEGNSASICVKIPTTEHKCEFSTKLVDNPGSTGPLLHQAVKAVKKHVQMYDKMRDLFECKIRKPGKGREYAVRKATHFR